MKTNNCPVCQTKLDGATCTEGNHKPEEGDYTICVYCTSFLRFEADLSLKELTEQEIGDMDSLNRTSLMRARAFLNPSFK